MVRKLLLLAAVFSVCAPALAQSVDTAWVRRYNGPGNSIDGAWDIAVDGWGNVYVTGETYNTLTSYDYATIKYLPNGDTAWVRIYNGPANASDVAEAMAVDDWGNVYVTGRSSGAGTGFDYATLKYDTDGNQLWASRYNGPGGGEDWPQAIAVDDSGNVYVTGGSYDSSTMDDYLTIKYDSDGDTVWVRRYNGPSHDADDGATSVCVDGRGNVYVAGYSSGGGASWDFATIKYYSNGDTVWVRRYDGPGNSHDGVYAMAVDNFGNVYVTGPSGGIGTDSDYATIKYYSNGDTAWVRRYNEPGDEIEFGAAIAVDDSGNVCVTGASSAGGYCTMKYDPDGNRRWVRYYGGFSRNDAATDIAVDHVGNVYVTGHSTGAGTSKDYATVKYHPGGDTAWTARYYGQAGYSKDQAWAIAVDGYCNVYVTGVSNNSETSFDYATIKYCEVNAPPNNFSLLFPPNKASTPRRVRFDWEEATDSNTCDQIRYDLHLSASSQFPADATIIDSNLVSSEHVKVVDFGTYFWKVKAKDGRGGETWCDHYRYFMVTGTPHSAGDFNKDGSVNVGDVVFFVSYLFRSGPAPDPSHQGDVNCDALVDVADAVYLIDYLFRGGESPCTR
ncbi:MAG: SBBP repeat-containing protein [Candidatus Zixiibacteriota bacterium]